MRIIDTKLQGIFLIETVLHKDSRGTFFESYREDVIARIDSSVNFVQDNYVNSIYGVVRGLHFQLPPYAQAKIVRVIRGSILDVVVDIRKNSPTFGEHTSFFLDAENNQQLYVSAGFAHGYAVLSDRAEVLYKCSRFYHPPSERGIRWDDKQLAIDWKLPLADIIISNRDSSLSSFDKFEDTL